MSSTDNLPRPADSPCLKCASAGCTSITVGNAEDLADALKMAADAADAAADNIHTKAQLANFAYKAWLIEHTEEAEKAKKTEELLTELISYGVMKGVIRNDE